MKNKNKFKYILLISILSFSVLVTNYVFAAEFSWKFNNGLPETRNESKELDRFAADVKKATNGGLDIKVYHGGSLGLKNNDVLRWLPTGASEMGLVWANYLGRDAPALNAVYIQGSVGSSEEHIKAIPVLKEIYASELKKWGIIPTGFMGLPILYASIFCKGEPVNTIEKLKTKKLRVWSKDMVDTFKKLGVSAQIIGQTEMYVALKTGVVDCAVYPALYAKTVSLQEVADSASYLYPVAGLPYVLGASERKWTKLPQSYKNAVKNAAEKIFQRSTDYTDDEANEMNARRNLESEGVDWLTDFSPSDQRTFLDAAAETWKEAANEAGGEAPKNRSKILQAIGR
ncbi:MAG: TRAP transporter substrate-binding protein DctP [Deltaproteobacteria bacterium]|jgi:TRAP-type C4-dicarboxylate transport system substrate-binding protein|nr:TRAP transporter substrate-binding protein DctP [Deltaproteobacteria bacterium]